MLVYLVGMMGSGKTTIARALAKACSMHAYDTDELVEEKEGMAISEIFEEKGEVYFRLAESEMLNQIMLREKNAIIATGGGLPCFQENMRIMKDSGTVVFLDVSPDILLKRIIEQKSENRPLISDSADPEQTIIKLKNLLDERIEIYSQAHFKVDGNKNISSIVDEIMSLIGVSNP